MRSAPEAVRYARRFTSYRHGYCLNFVQTMLASPWSGPYALWAWQHAKRKHTDATPPAGVPVYWSGGQYGHVALSVGGGRVRSTDWPRRGQVGETTISNLTRAWGKHYEGWAEDLGGRAIAGISTRSTTEAHGRTRHVYVNRLHDGVTDSDSVRHVQRRLIALGYSIPAGATGNWHSQTTAAVRKLQRDWHQAPQYATGKRLGPRQTARLFRGVGGVVIHP